MYFIYQELPLTMESMSEPDGIQRQVHTCIPFGMKASKRVRFGQSYKDPLTTRLSGLSAAP